MTLIEQFEQLESEIEFLLNMNAVIGDDDTVFDTKSQNHDQAKQILNLVKTLRYNLIDE